MKSIQLASICCIAIGCASQTESRKPAPEIPAAATPAAGGAATPAASPAAASATQRGPSAPGAMTASEAAEKAHQEWLRTHGGGGGDPSAQRAQAGSPESGAADQSPCAGDADCSLTRIAAGGCCPTLCEIGRAHV